MISSFMSSGMMEIEVILDGWRGGKGKRSVTVEC